MQSLPPFSGCEEDLDESAAPGDLELVRRFVNTLELENGGLDQLDSVDGLRGWLREWDLPSGGLTKQDLPRAIELREALRSLIATEPGAAIAPGTQRRLNDAIAGSSVTVRFDRDGSARLEPAGTGFGAGVAAIAAIVREAMISGEWKRLKICSSDDCRWAYFDRSRNHSRNWCRMQECGNRAKVRAFRERQNSR